MKYYNCCPRKPFLCIMGETDSTTRGCCSLQRLKTTTHTRLHDRRRRVFRQKWPPESLTLPRSTSDTDWLPSSTAVLAVSNVAAVDTFAKIKTVSDPRQIGLAALLDTCMTSHEQYAFSFLGFFWGGRRGAGSLLSSFHWKEFFPSVILQSGSTR